MRRAVVLSLLVVVAACSANETGLNIYESSGLDDADSVEIVIVRDDGSQQWMTLSEDLQVRKLAQLLDAPLGEAVAEDCGSTVTVTFYSDDASNQQLEVGCDRVRLTRAAGESTYAAPEFSAAIDDLLSAIPSP